MFEPDFYDRADFDRALTGPHEGVSRVEVWSAGQPIDSVPVGGTAPVDDGSVTDTWVVAGVRRTLDLSVRPDQFWRRWLTLPNLELRPFRGVRFSRSYTVECPLGRFPVLPPSGALPAAQVKISGEDYYQRVDQAPFPRPFQTGYRTAVSAVMALLTSGGRLLQGFTEPTVTTTRNGRAAPSTLEGSRHDAVLDLCRSFGMEVYFDRLGVLTIANTRRLQSPQTTALLAQVESVAENVDDSKIFNVVVVTGQNFPAQTAAITDPNHPASAWRIGERVLTRSSQSLDTFGDALLSAQRTLSRVSSKAYSWTYTRIPDPRTDAGDTITGATMDGGTHVSQIQSVTHPLGADGRQTIVTVSTQPDPDQ